MTTASATPAATLPAAPIVVQPEPTNVPTPAPIGIPDGFVSKADHDALLTKVREEEKRKLHKKLDEEKARADAYEAREKAAKEEAEKARLAQLPTEQRFQEELLALRKKSEDQAAELAAQIAANAQQQLAYQVSMYREAKLREAGPRIIPDLVGGSTYEEVDASIMVAKAEYERWDAHFKAQYAQQQPVIPVVPVAVPAPAAPAHPLMPVPVQPTVTFASPAPAAPAGAAPSIDIAMLTSPDAVRSGAYRQHREAVHAAMRQGSAPAPIAPPMRVMDPAAFTGAPPTYQPPVAPATSAAGFVPGMQYVFENGAFRPLGLATPTPSHPSMHAVPAPAAMPPIVQVPDGSSSIDPRALAARAAHSALQNPALAAAKAAGMATQPLAGHHEYQFNATHGRGAPDVHALTGAHPQIGRA